MTDMSDDPKNTASPACSAHEAGDAYMGFAPRDELVAFLNTLLEAERAGARICQRTAHEARDAGNESLADLMAAVRDDEAHWCAVLTRATRTLEASRPPSPAPSSRRPPRTPTCRSRGNFTNPAR